MIGTFPYYLQAADEAGLGAYNIPRSLYNFLGPSYQFTANQAYLQAQLSLGRQVYLAGPALAKTNSTLFLELEYLKSRAVTALLYYF